LIDLETGTGADLNNPHSSYAEGLASLERLRGMDIEAYLPSHGEPVLGRENVDALIERMIENTHGYIIDVRAFLDRSEGTITDMLPALMPGSPFTLKAMRMMQILTVLKHLRETGEVTARKNAGRHIWSLNS
jgi:hypothetical protein